MRRKICMFRRKSVSYTHLINFYALLCKVCVAIFVFISGYGITASYYKKFADWEPSVGEIKDCIDVYKRQQ